MRRGPPRPIGDVRRRGALRVTLMVSYDKLFGMSEMLHRFPGPLLWSVPNPIHEIPQLPASDLGIQHLLDFILWFPFNNVWRLRYWLRPPSDHIRVIRVQERGVEHVMDAPLRW